MTWQIDLSKITNFIHHNKILYCDVKVYKFILDRVVYV